MSDKQEAQLIRPASIKIDAEAALRRVEEILAKPVRIEIEADAIARRVEQILGDRTARVLVEVNAGRTLERVEALADRLEGQAVAGAWWAGCGAGGLCVGLAVLVVAAVVIVLGRINR